MGRLVALTLALALWGLAPNQGVASPLTPDTRPDAATGIVLAQSGQPGWWERENQYREMEHRYWRLRGKERQRYHQLQRRIEDYDRQIAELNELRNLAIQEQQVILSYRH